MALIERIITVYNDKGSKQAVKDVNKLEKSFAEAGKKIAKSFLIAGAAVGALAIKLGKDAVEGAMADQKAQIALATALRNTIGATDSQIASTVQYLDALELQVGVNNDQLIPSLQTLVQATGDLSQAQSLQALALDISAGSGRDLGAVTNALVRALGGNIGALKRLGIPLDDAIVKNKDLNAALTVLGDTFQGQAGKRAETFEFQMERLRLQFDQTLDSLGYALIPVLADLAEMIRIEVLPMFEEFITANKEGIADALKNAIDNIIGATRALAKMFKLIADNIGVIKAFASLMIGVFVGTKVAAGIQLIAAGIAGLITLFKRQAVAAGAAGTATALATGGATALSAAAGLAAFGVAAGTAMFAINKFTDSVNENKVAVQQQSQVVAGHLADLKRIEADTRKANIQTNFRVRNLGNLNKKTKEQIQLDQVLKKLQKAGVTPTSEKDPIQLEAARLNLLRQNRIAEAARVEEMMKAFEAQMKMNIAAQRYADLLQVLADSKISDQEVSVLAQKWNITKGEVLEYIARIYAANSTDIDSGPVIELLMAWGLTREQAQKYVDFTRALKDEKLDDSEIEKLMGKWGMTRAEVIAYSKQVQAGTVFSTTWDDPGKAAEQSWLDALAALNAYLTALRSQTPQVPTPIVPSDKPKVIPVTPNVPSRVTTPVIDQIESLSNLRNTIDKNSQLGVQLKERIDELSKPLDFSSAISTAGDEQTRLRELRINERPGITSTSTFDPAAFRMSENAGMTVNVTVQGNVQTEADLADAIRRRILLEQQSGKPILFVGGL